MQIYQYTNITLLFILFLSALSSTPIGASLQYSLQDDLNDVSNSFPKDNTHSIEAAQSYFHKLDIENVSHNTHFDFDSSHYSLESNIPQFTVQQTKQQLSVRLLPAIDQKRNVAVPFYGRISCADICVSNLGLTILWREEARTTVASTSWFQVFVTEGYGGDAILVSEHLPTNVTGSVIAYSIFDNSSTDPARKDLQYLYFIGEIKWKRLSRDNLLLNFHLREFSNIRGQVILTLPRYYQDTTRNTALLQDTSFLGVASYLSQSEEDPSIGFQYSIENVPFEYNSAYIQHFGWIQMVDNKQIECNFNGVTTTSIKFVLCDACPIPLVLGFTVTALHPSSRQNLTFSATTNFALSCTGPGMGFFSPADFNISPGIGIQVQILPTSQLIENAQSLEYKALSQRLIRTAIINPPPASSTDILPPEFTDKFGFFVLNSTNRPSYEINPKSDLLWTGHSRQPLTNGPICYSHYLRSFAFNFASATINPEVQVSLESTKSAKFLVGTWTLQLVSPGPGSSGTFQLVSFGQLIYRHPRREANLWYDSSSHIHFETISFRNLTSPVNPDEQYELIISLSVTCENPNDDPLSSLVLSYAQKNVTSIDHNLTPFSIVENGSWSPYGRFDSTQLSWKVNRVNLTESPAYHDQDIASWTYRFTFAVTISLLPTDVLYWTEPECSKPTPSPSSSFYSLNNPNSAFNSRWDTDELLDHVVDNQIYDEVQHDKATGLKQTIQPVSTHFNTNRSDPIPSTRAVNFTPIQTRSKALRRLVDYSRKITKEEYQIEQQQLRDGTHPIQLHSIRNLQNSPKNVEKEKVANVEKDEKDEKDGKNEKSKYYSTPDDLDIFLSPQQNNGDGDSDHDVDPPKSEPRRDFLKWIELSFSGEEYFFQGDFENCTINGQHVRPQLSYNCGDDPLFFEKGASSTNIGFFYDFNQSETSGGSGSSSQQDRNQYLITCFDVFLVNMTTIDFNPDPISDRNWHDPTNPLSLLNPNQSPVIVKFSHHPSLLNTSNIYLLGTVAEFDPIPLDILFIPALILIGVMLAISLILFGLWVYSGTEHGANNAVHRSDRTKQQHKVQPLKPTDTSQPPQTGLNHTRYERMQ